MDVRTLTPVIGAGVRSQQVDQGHPIRGETVRGHLRFWWRTVSRGGPLDEWIEKRLQAERGGRADVRLAAFDSVKRLRLREAAVWGSSSQAGLVTVQVQSTIERCKNVRQGSIRDVVSHLGRAMGLDQVNKVSPIGYAAFPLQPNRGDSKDARSEVFMGRFTVRIDWTPWARHLCEHVKDQVEQEVREALWRWVHLGGIGMRWRRGFGALTVDDIPRSLDEIAKHLADHQPEGLPAVRAVLVVKDKTRHAPKQGKLNSDVWEVWEHCIRPLQRYRQLREPKKNGRTGYTKTRWPEANIIRALARGEKVNQEKLRVPRALLGLPVNFHFQRESTPDAELRPEKDPGSLLGRFPSPFILRPVLVGSSVYPMCVWLESPLTDDQKDGFVCMSLKVGDHVISVPPKAALRKREDRLAVLEAQSENSPQFEYAEDPLADFLRHLKSQGFGVIYPRNAT
ncbi:type III-B CRISPR module RAMP protein Cmr1 [Alicyclobacillus vulcanalis]|uniref:type III-B CRISPR module RAMP protein Cmr1 n=1 Tax=Alicyclobacillus vulcanalis TaxID=252246 RepID=UPI001F456BEC|nr:type III-B CRISPR module RAMP protein Cmr1 [Alicyclobacillus vulcanalis]